MLLLGILKAAGTCQILDVANPGDHNIERKE